MSMLLVFIFIIIGGSYAGFNPLYLHTIDRDLITWVNGSRDVFIMNVDQSFAWGSPQLFGGTYRVKLRDKSWSYRQLPAWRTTHIRKNQRVGNSELVVFNNSKVRAIKGNCVSLDELGCDTLLNLTSVLPRYNTLYYHEVIEQIVPNYGVVHEVLKDRREKQVCITMRDHLDRTPGKKWTQRLLIETLLLFRSISDKKMKRKNIFKFVNDSRNCFTTSREDVSYYAPKEIRTTSRKEVVRKSLALYTDLSRLRTECTILKDGIVFGNLSGTTVNLLLLVREKGTSRSFVDDDKVRANILNLADKPDMDSYKFVLRYHMPNYTYYEQLCLYGASDVFLHWHGAGGANAMYMKMNSIVVEMGVFHRESLPHPSNSSASDDALIRRMEKTERSFYDLYFWRSNVHPTVDFRPDLRWYVVAFQDSKVLLQRERKDISGWVNDHWKWNKDRFRADMDRQGHNWSQRVKEALVDLGHAEASRLLDAIAGAIKQRK